MKKPTLKEAKELITKYPTENYYMVSNFKQFINRNNDPDDNTISLCAYYKKCKTILNKNNKGDKMNKLEIVVKESGLEKTKADYILEKFSDAFKVAGKWEEKAKGIKVEDETQISEMKIARIGRLELRDKRVDIEKERKRLKEQSLREGKAIDGIANVLKALIIPIEKYLDDQEHFVENKKKEEAKIRLEEAEKKAEEERIRLEKKELERLKKQEIENKKMKQELERKEQERFKRENEIRLEREKQEQEKREQENRILKQQIENEKEINKRKEVEEKLKNMIECPRCHHKFNLEK